MKTIKKYLWVCIGLVITGFTFSCQKPVNTPSIGGPLLVLTPSADSGYATDQVAIDYSATSPINKIKRVQIYTQFLSNPKVTAKDSTIASPSPAIDLNFDYTIPASAIKGQQTVITFIITDGSGNTTTKTATITVTGSRPSITVTPTTTNANAGDTVYYSVTMQSPDKDIYTLDVSQIINNGAATSINGFTYSANPQLTVNTIYKYPVPKSPTVKSGDMIGLVFTVANTSAVTNFTTAMVKVN